MAESRQSCHLHSYIARYNFRQRVRHGRYARLLFLPGSLYGYGFYDTCSGDSGGPVMIFDRAAVRDKGKNRINKQGRVFPYTVQYIKKKNNERLST